MIAEYGDQTVPVNGGLIEARQYQDLETASQSDAPNLVVITFVR